MLEYIHLKHFKTLKNNGFPLKNLNLFSGLNGMGKSSVLQMLLLLRQSYEKKLLFSKGLMLKGEYLNLGLGSDVLSLDIEDNESLSCLLKWSVLQDPVTFTFDYLPESDLQPIRDFDLNAEDAFHHALIIQALALFNARFEYLAAERVAPQTFYALSDYHVNTLNTLGQNGLYSAHYLAENKDLPLPVAALQHPRAQAKDLLANTEAWMSDISPGLKIRAHKKTEMDLVSLNYAFIQGKGTTRDFKPQNVGFGLTYVLPVVMAILKAQKGDLVLIENPESHLHPAGQSVLGRLAACAAANGIQLLIETHSDHFLNGVRVAVKNKLIAPEQVALFFLDRDDASEEHAAEVSQPVLDPEGRIDIWPKGFFDEWENQLDQLL